MKLDRVRNEIARVRRAICAQEREIALLHRAGISTASAELLLARMRAKVDDLCREREDLHRAPRRPPVGGRARHHLPRDILAVA